MSLRSGWSIGRLGHIPVGLVLTDVGHILLVCVRRQLIGSSVVDEFLVYP